MKMNTSLNKSKWYFSYKNKLNSRKFPRITALTVTNNNRLSIALLKKRPNFSTIKELYYTNMSNKYSTLIPQ